MERASPSKTERASPNKTEAKLCLYMQARGRRCSRYLAADHYCVQLDCSYGFSFLFQDIPCVGKTARPGKTEAREERSSPSQRARRRQSSVSTCRPAGGDAPDGGRRSLQANPRRIVGRPAL